MNRIVAGWILVLATVSPALSQERRNESIFDPTRWGVVYDVPATKNVKLTADVPYLQDAKGKLTIDVYAPPDLKRGEKRPAVVFLNAIGDAPAPNPKVKTWGIYRTWPRLVAAHGLVGVSMDMDGSRIQECLGLLFEFLASKGGDHGIDGSRIGVYAASANVTGACEYLFGGKCAPGIRAAALYYGMPPTQSLRQDLPVLFLLPESDVPNSIEEFRRLWPRVIEEKAPWTLLFGTTMPHAFDAFTDDDSARRLIQQTIAFWKSHLEAVPKPPWQPAPEREIMAALYGRDTQKSATLLGEYVKTHPNDASAFAALGRVHAENGRYREAGEAYEKAYALGEKTPPVLAGLGLVRNGQQRWQEAADLLGQAVDAGARDSRVVGGLAHAQLMLGRNEEGVRSYERAFEMGIPPGPNTRGIAYYNLACGYSRLGKLDEAVEKLGKAIDEGFGDRRTFESDSDLASLRTDPRFQQLLARLDAR